MEDETNIWKIETGVDQSRRDYRLIFLQMQMQIIWFFFSEFSAVFHCFASRFSVVLVSLATFLFTETNSLKNIWKSCNSCAK